MIASGYVGGLSEAAHRLSERQLRRGGRSPRAAPTCCACKRRRDRLPRRAGCVSRRFRCSTCGRPMGRTPHVVSSVGGRPIPQVQALIAGFRAGRETRRPEDRAAERIRRKLHPSEPACKNVALEPDRRAPFPGRVRRRWGLRSRRARGGQAEGGLRSWCRHRPVVARHVHPHERGPELETRRLRPRQARRSRTATATGDNLSWDMRHHFVGLGKFSPKVSSSPFAVS